MDNSQATTVKLEMFKQILQLHDVRLSEKSWDQLRHLTVVRMRGEDQIKYKEALPLLQLNLNLADPLSKEWVVRQQMSGNSTKAYSQISMTSSQLNSKSLRLININQGKANKTEMQESRKRRFSQESKSSSDESLSQDRMKQPMVNLLGRSTEGKAPQMTQFEAMQHEELFLPQNKDGTPKMWQFDKKQKFIDGQAGEGPAKTSIQIGSFKKQRNLKNYATKTLGNYSDGFNMISHMKFGENKPGLMKRQMLKHGLDESQIRAIQLKNTKQERVTSLRPRVVDTYIAQILKHNQQVDTTEVVREMYRKNMDNRILNNLRQQVNEIVEDPRQIFPVLEFKQMWFSFFKAEEHAEKIYDMLVPKLIVIE